MRRELVVWLGETIAIAGFSRQAETMAMRKMQNDISVQVKG